MSAANKENEWPVAGTTLAPKSGGLRSAAPMIDDGSLTLALSELLGRTHAEATHDPLVLAVRRDRHAPTPWRQLLQREEQLAEAAPDKLAAQRKLLVTYSHATRAMGSTDEHRKQPDFAAVWVSFARLQGELSEVEGRQLFKWLKSERIGLDSEHFYTAWAAFEQAHGHPGKAASVLELGHSRLGAAAFAPRGEQPGPGLARHGVRADDGGDDDTVVFKPRAAPEAPAAPAPPPLPTSTARAASPAHEPPAGRAGAASALWQQEREGWEEERPSSAAEPREAAGEADDADTVVFRPRTGLPARQEPPKPANVESCRVPALLPFRQAAAASAAAGTSTCAQQQGGAGAAAGAKPRKAFVRLGLRGGPARRVNAPDEASGENAAAQPAGAGSATPASAQLAGVQPTAEGAVLCVASAMAEQQPAAFAPGAPAAFSAASASAAHAAHAAGRARLGEPAPPPLAGAHAHVSAAARATCAEGRQQYNGADAPPASLPLARVPGRASVAEQAEQEAADAAEALGAIAEEGSSSCCSEHTVGSDFWVEGKLYTRLAVIGRGGTSKVFRVMDSQSKELFALKRVIFQDQDAAFVANVRNEIALLRSLQGVPTIIRMVAAEVDEPNETAYMVMELGEIDLASLLQRQQGKPFNHNFTGMYWQQMLTAVHELHEMRVVHSDLKPANFLSVQGSLKLIDFGIAKKLSNDTTNIVRDSQVGTVNYMSPESITADMGNLGMLKLGRPSDVWSLGCILFAMVYGKTPFEHVKNLIARLRAISDPAFNIEFKPIPNPYLLDVLKRCLRRNPNERPTIPVLLAHPFLQPPAIVSAPAAAPAASPSVPVAPALAAAVTGSGGGGATLTLEQMQQLIGQLSAQISLRTQGAPSGQQVPEGATATEQLTKALLEQLVSAQQKLEASAACAELPALPAVAPPATHSEIGRAAPNASQPSASDDAAPQIVCAPAPPPPAPPPPAWQQSRQQQTAGAEQLARSQLPSVQDLRSRITSLGQVGAPASAPAGGTLADGAAEMHRQILERHGQLNHVEPRVQAALPGRSGVEVGRAEAQPSGWLSAAEEKARRVQQAQQARGEYASDEPNTGDSFS